MRERETLSPGTTLLVASSGGHLSELHELAPRFGLRGPVEWATFAGEQSRSLLAGQRVHHLTPSDQRNSGAVMANSARAIRIMRRGRFERVVSTGASIALSFLPVARTLGVRCHYIESAARTDEPSLSGRLLERVPGIRMYAQSEGLTRRGWEHRGSVFDAFEPAPLAAPVTVGRVVVTVGTMEYSFRRLIERLAGLLGPDRQVLWQTGHTDVAGLNIVARPFLPAPELEQAIREADVVVAHAGVGSALHALSAGRCPVLAARTHAAGEHVDDHQRLLAGELARRGLAIEADPGQLTLRDLEAAARRSVRRTAVPRPFLLRE